MKYFGIDPGLTGYICILSNDYHSNFIKMPIINVENSNSVDTRKLFVELSEHDINDNDVCILENQHSFANMSMQSMFKLGRVFGNIESIVNLLFESVTYISPQKWQNELSKKYLTGQEIECLKNETVFINLLDNIVNSEFKLYIKKRLEQKSFKFTKVKAAYLFNRISEKYNIDDISYENHNLIDSFLIAFYGSILKKDKVKLNLQKKSRS